MPPLRRGGVGLRATRFFSFGPGRANKWKSRGRNGGVAVTPGLRFLLSVRIARAGGEGRKGGRKEGREKARKSAAGEIIRSKI